MQAQALHSWNVSPEEARRIQKELAGRVSTRNELGGIRRVAGADISIDRANNRARVAVVILSFPELELIEKRMVEKEIPFPYIPGLLSFREVPPILLAFEKVQEAPDLLLADGQGVAHPRRFGLACHLGLVLDLPAIGCAKSLLVGRQALLDESAGSQAEVIDRGQVVAVALRTKQRSKPIYVSVGHKIDLPTAVNLVSQCTRGYRLPEPTRLADRAAAGAVEDIRPAVIG